MTTMNLTPQEQTDVLKRIRQAESKCRKTEAQWTAAKEDAKSAKEEYDAAIMTLRDTIRELDEPKLIA